MTAWFLTQPKLPRMALITPRVEEEGEGDEVLVLAALGVVLLRVPIVAVAGGERGRPPPVTVAVWGDRVEVVDQGDAVALWLARFLETPGLRLVVRPRGLP